MILPAGKSIYKYRGLNGVFHIHYNSVQNYRKYIQTFHINFSDNAVEFLTQLGFRLDYEFAAKGTIFRKGRMKITVSKIFKIVQPEPFPGGPQPSTTVPATEGNLEPLSGSHLVELSVQTHSGDDAVAEDMKNFAEQLKPVIFLDKIDPRRQGLI